MWEQVLAIGLAWGLAGVAKWWLRGSDFEAFGIGFVLLPVFMNLVRPFQPAAHGGHRDLRLGHVPRRESAAKREGSRRARRDRRQGPQEQAQQTQR